VKVVSSLDLISHVKKAVQRSLVDLARTRNRREKTVVFREAASPEELSQLEEAVLKEAALKVLQEELQEVALVSETLTRLPRND